MGKFARPLTIKEQKNIIKLMEEGLSYYRTATATGATRWQVWMLRKSMTTKPTVKRKACSEKRALKGGKWG